MQNAFLFLANAVCSFFSALLLLRLIMQWRRISFYSPAGGFILKFTNWAVLPMRRVIPGAGGLDWASLFAAFLTQIFFAALLCFFSPIVHTLGDVISARGLFAVLALALTNLAQLLLTLLIILLFAQAILSWVNPCSPLVRPLAQITSPLLAPVRRLIPPISGIDISPLIVIVILQALSLLIR
ncbi:MAG: YggT family protein [Zoogloeaceae bacterium]|jgi:YggT family protein|nr:YggT family protein [Zoogloeaceae bacterium]